jgi:hypothetical protein
MKRLGINAREDERKVIAVVPRAKDRSTIAELKKLQVNDVLANIGTLRSTLSSVAVNES